MLLFGSEIPAMGLCIKGRAVTRWDSEVKGPLQLRSYSWSLLGGTEVGKAGKTKARECCNG